MRGRRSSSSRVSRRTSTVALAWRALDRRDRLLARADRVRGPRQGGYALTVARTAARRRAGCSSPGAATSPARRDDDLGPRALGVRVYSSATARSLAGCACMTAHEVAGLDHVLDGMRARSIRTWTPWLEGTVRSSAGPTREVSRTRLWRRSSTLTHVRDVGRVPRGGYDRVTTSRSRRRPSWSSRRCLRGGHEPDHGNRHGEYVRGDFRTS